MGQPRPVQPPAASSDSPERVGGACSAMKARGPKCASERDSIAERGWNVTRGRVGVAISRIDRIGAHTSSNR